MANTQVYQVITDRILGLLDKGTVPWQKPWDSESGLPKNLKTRRPYNGINIWMLLSAGYESPYWLTFNQAKAEGASVRKGEKATTVIYWNVQTTKPDEEGNTKKLFILRYYNVFNVAQVDGITVPDDGGGKPELSPIEACEKLVGGYPKGPAIVHGDTRAYYRPSTDSVHMPNLQAFRGAEEYYSTLFHELVHSTGHKDRLDRATLKDAVRFGDVSYCREELVAEMGATFLCGLAGIGNSTITNSAAYIGGWKSVLRGDPTCIVTAASQAQRAVEHITSHHSTEVDSAE